MSAADLAMPHLIDRLPPVRGRLTANAPLAAHTWFRVGGPAEILFRPTGRDDLASFLVALPADVPVTVIGVASNLLVRDGGVPGVVIRLGGAFAEIEIGSDIRAGAGALDTTVAAAAQQTGIAGLEFLSGIPGTIGGAVAMNAGAYGGEVSNVLIEAEVMRRDGSVRTLPRNELGLSYRHSDLPGEASSCRRRSRRRRAIPARSPPPWRQSKPLAATASRSAPAPADRPSPTRPATRRGS